MLRTAAADGRCVVTFNRDDLLALHRSGIDHSGIVVCKDDTDRIGLASVLHEYLLTQQDLRNRLIRVLKMNKPGMSQPMFTVREYYSK